MKTYWQFFKSVLRHKWYVLIAGCRLGVPVWRLLIHDWTKFTPSEFGPYAREFYGTPHSPTEFDTAWHHHKMRNKHHWNWWVSIDGFESECTSLGYPRLAYIPMPMIYVREMVADWLAAGKAYGGTWPNLANFTWYKTNRPGMFLHPETQSHIDRVLAEAAKLQW